MTALFDFSPPKNTGDIPSGTYTVFDMRSTPGWRRWLDNIDFGCIKSVYTCGNPFSTIGELKNNTPNLLSTLRLAYQSHGLSDMLKSNRYVNLYCRFSQKKRVTTAEWFDDNTLYLVVHTGSEGNQHRDLKNYADAPDEYDQRYERAVQSAVDVTERLAAVAGSVLRLESPTLLFSHPHCLISQEGTKAHVYKGVNRVTGSPPDLQILTSSAHGSACIYRPSAYAVNVGAVPHGTGNATDQNAEGIPRRIEGEFNPLASALSFMNGQGLIDSSYPQTSLLPIMSCNFHNHPSI